MRKQYTCQIYTAAQQDIITSKQAAFVGRLYLQERKP
jgi:hypothetical protein